MGQHPVNIVYPIDGATYPAVDPPVGGVSSAYVTASFGTTCADSDFTVEWGFDSTSVGQARFRDEFSAQFTYKLSGGSHVFWVRSGCGENKVKFNVGT